MDNQEAKTQSKKFYQKSRTNQDSKLGLLQLMAYSFIQIVLRKFLDITISKNPCFLLRTKVRSLFGFLDAQDSPRTKVRGFQES